MDELEVELWKFMVFDILHFRQQRYREFQLVAAQSCVPELQEAFGDHYHIQRRVDLMIPNAREVDVSVLLTATKRAYRRLITAAVDEIRNGWNEAAQFFLREGESRGLGTRLKMRLHCDYY